jgi:hypothetical protein
MAVGKNQSRHGIIFRQDGVNVVVDKTFDCASKDILCGDTILVRTIFK